MTDGIVVVDKPAGWTSHDVVARCRRIYGQRRVGHSGTLDPGATGVLILGLGQATRLLRFLTDLPKHYTGEIVLGVATTTLDDGGDETGRWEMASVTLEEVRTAASRLTGTILQIPPMYSAVHVGGRRLHELARAGVVVERAPRPVTVERFAIEATPEQGVWRAEVVCSSGTYVRVLAADVGAALGGGAHLRELRRTAVGSFDLRAARSLADLEADAEAAVIASGAALSDYPAMVVDGELASAVGYGRPVPAQAAGAVGPGPWRVLDTSGVLLAMYERRGSGGGPPFGTGGPASSGGGDVYPAVVVRPAG